MPYLWQPAITSQVVQQTKMEERQAGFTEAHQCGLLMVIAGMPWINSISTGQVGVISSEVQVPLQQAKLNDATSGRNGPKICQCSVVLWALETIKTLQLCIKAGKLYSVNTKSMDLKITPPNKLTATYTAKNPVWLGTDMFIYCRTSLDKNLE